MANGPTSWSLAKNPPISNQGTIVDKRLTTITPDNPTGYVKLSATTEDPIIKNMEYAIDNNGVVTYRYTTATGVQRQYNNIQEMVSIGPTQINNWNPSTTTPRFKDSLQTNLSQRTREIILDSPSSPIGQPGSGDPQGGNEPLDPSTPTLPSPPNYETQEIPLQATQLKIVNEPYIQYPDKMSPEQDKIKFTAVKIKPRDQVNTGDTLGFEFGKPQYEKVDNPIYLAIQAPISDQNSVEWGADNVTAIDAALYHESYKLMGGTLEQAGKNLEETLKRIYSVANAQSERIKRAMAGQAASLNNVLARTDNVVLNPNMELLFQGPQLRPFTFSFKMSAREPGEAERVKRIIKYFKYHMAVRREKDQLFLRAPHVFTIQYIKGNKNRTDELHPGINLISPTDDTKACALTNFSVDYTPLGSYATYADGTMVSYTLSLQFQEITPVYDTDYNDYPHPIGF